MIKLCFFALILGFLSSCARLDPGIRRVDAESLARENGFHSVQWQTSDFLIQGYQRLTDQNPAAISIYLEGDGLAYRRRSRPSSDPTPIEAYALKLAVQDPSRNVIYLARPCQFLSKQQLAECDQQYWTSHRYAEEVVDAYAQILDQIQGDEPETKLRLVGYSGGGALVALLAGRRNDIERMLTVAANLDLKAWTEHHRLTPMPDSVNPADQAQALATQPQWHLAGGRDDIVPALVLESYMSHLPNTQQTQFRVIEDYDHQCCWQQTWPEWLRWFYR